MSKGQVDNAHMCVFVETERLLLSIKVECVVYIVCGSVDLHMCVCTDILRLMFHMYMCVSFSVG